MDFYGKTVRGSVRQNNEDACHFPLPGDKLQNIFLVADGMGGMKSGEIASILAVSTAVLHMEKYYGTEDAPTLLRGAFSKANKMIYITAREEGNSHEMGTTLSAVLAEESTLYVGHVGDSRVYGFAGGNLTQITSDHTYVQELVNGGVITSAEAKTHPEKHKITRALGPEKFMQVDVSVLPWAREEWVLLCSDGLYNMVSNERISAILQDSTGCKEAVTRLVTAAEEAGGKDNITVICVKNC